MTARETLTSSFFRIKTNYCITNEPPKPTATIQTDHLKKFKGCLTDLKNAIAGLKEEKTTAAQKLAEYYDLLSDLYTKCPNTYKKCFKSTKRITSGLTNCINTIHFARKIEASHLKNDLIIRSIVKLTRLLSETTELVAALDQLADKMAFLKNLHDHLSKGLSSLSITHELSAEKRAHIIRATIPVLSLIQQILSPPQSSRPSFFRTPLMLAGGALGLYLGYSTAGLISLSTAILTPLWAAAGAQTGEAADTLAEQCKRPRR